jgi:hypothetical protein
MTGPTRRLRDLARRITDVYLAHMPLRGAILTGSGARGDADRYSDLDLILYADDVPPAEAPAAAQRELGAGPAVSILPHGPNGFLDQFPLDGVQCQVGVMLVADVEEELDRLLVRHEGLETPLAEDRERAARGDVLPRRGAARGVAGPRRGVSESLRVAMVAHWWRFFPRWYHDAPLAERDAGLWRQEELVNAAFALVGTLAGVNRLYFARFEFKRQRAFLAKMTVAPERFADRLELLFTLPPADAIAELAALVTETQAIVERELPSAEVSLRRPPGARVEPWS